MEKYKEIGLDHPIGMTLIIGPNNSYTSTILAGLRRTVTFVRGFAFINTDESLNLLKPEDVLSGFFQFLRRQHDELKKTNRDMHKSLRHVVVSNFPKTGDQMKNLLEFCPGLRLAYVDAPRDDSDKAYCMAMEFKRDHKDQFIMIKHSEELYYQAEHIVRKMKIEHEEKGSMIKQIFAKESPARLFFDQIKGPKPTRMATTEAVQFAPRATASSPGFSGMQPAAC